MHVLLASRVLDCTSTSTSCNVLHINVHVRYQLIKRGAGWDTSEEAEAENQKKNIPPESILKGRMPCGRGCQHRYRPVRLEKVLPPLKCMGLSH